MKVGVNARAFSDPEPDGAVQTAIRLTRKLADSEEYDVLLYGHPSVARLFADLPVRSSLYLSDSQTFGVFWERTVLPVLAVRDGIDVLICPNGNAPMISHGPFKTVMYIHDVNALRGMSSPIHRAYRRIAIPLGARAADSVVTVSEFSKREISAYLPVPPEKIHVIRNGVDDYYLSDEPGEAFNLPDKYILYVGAMNPRKNVGSLIDAYDRLKADYNCNHRLVIVGPRNKFVYDEMNVDASRPDIVTPGFLPKEELKYTFEEADLFVYPSKYEGFGLPPLEAMACGTPVVAAEVTALPEILDGAVEFVDPYDVSDITRGMRKVLADSTYQEHLLRAGREQTVQYTWDRAVEEMKRLLRSLADEGGAT